MLLKTGIVHHPVEPGGLRPVTVDHVQMATAQKLLLFWRKPAVRLRHVQLMWKCLLSRDDQRKCWWDGIEIELPASGDQPAKKVKLWARRVWTLELSLVRGARRGFGCIQI